MNASILAWWRTRTLREQRLLLLMLAVLAVVLAWLLVVRPLGDALSSARERHGAAVLAVVEARAQAEAISELQNRRAPPLAAPLETVLGQAANEAGFTVARIESQGAGEATIVIDAVRPQAFFGWVHQLESDQGLIVERLSASTNSDQTLSVQLTLRARGQ